MYTTDIAALARRGPVALGPTDTEGAVALKGRFGEAIDVAREAGVAIALGRRYEQRGPVNGRRSAHHPLHVSPRVGHLPNGFLLPA